MLLQIIFGSDTKYDKLTWGLRPVELNRCIHGWMNSSDSLIVLNTKWKKKPSNTDKCIYKQFNDFNIMIQKTNSHVNVKLY